MLVTLRAVNTSFLTGKTEGTMSHYHDSDDLKVLAEFKKLAPAEFKGFVELDGIVGRADARSRGNIASSSRWPSPARPSARTASTCIPGLPRRPAQRARKSPRPRCCRAGAATTHGALALKLFDQE
jgi:hypothetical protein